MDKMCDKCKKNPANVSYTETINNKTIRLNLCSNCANQILNKKEQFLNSFFSLDPFKEIDKMFDSMFIPIPLGKSTKKQIQPSPQQKPQSNPREERLKELKLQIDALKQEEGIAVMLQDYLKAAEIKKKRDKLQKEAETIINQQL